MNTPTIEKKPLIIAAGISMVIILCLFLRTYFNTQTTIVFCDVGQGDATYVRVHNKIDIVIDAGPNTRIVECLGTHMPFYDRSIELAILTHPQEDHMHGFMPILDRYSMKYFFTTRAHADSNTYHELLTKLAEKKVSIVHPDSNTVVDVDSASLTFYWPTYTFIQKFNTSAKSLDLNDTSIIFTLRDGTHSVLFTGDASPIILNDLLKQPALKSSILKVPHHGSRNGLTHEFLKLAEPRLAVISSGKKNRYGHPSPDILQMLEKERVLLKRTDLEGDIVIRLQEEAFSVSQ